MKRLLMLVALLTGMVVLVLSFSVSAQDTVNLRVAHLSPDTPAVDVYVNGEVAIAGLEFPNISEFTALEAGTYSVAVAPAGTSLADAAIGPADFELSGGFITVAAIGSLNGGTLTAAVVAEDFGAATLDTALVTVFHAIEGLPAVDVRAGGGIVVDGLAYPNTVGGNDGAYTFSVPAGAYDLTVTPNATSDPVLLSAPGTELAGGVAYFIAAAGTADAPTVSVASYTVVTPPAPETIGASSEQISSARDRIFSLGQPPATEEPVEEEPIGASSEQIGSAVDRIFALTPPAAPVTEEPVEEEPIGASSEQIGSAVDRIFSLGGDEAEVEGEAALGTIADIAAGDENFSTLTMILTQAAPDYLAALSDPDAEFTVFAPNNEAFDALAAGLGIVIEDALVFPDILIDILGYHVIEGAVPAETVLTLDGQSVATIQGEEIAISIVDGAVVLNGTVSVIVTDIMADNGIIHVIDAVMLPESTIATLQSLGLNP